MSAAAARSTSTQSAWPPSTAKDSAVRPDAGSSASTASTSFSAANKRSSFAASPSRAAMARGRDGGVGGGADDVAVLVLVARRREDVNMGWRVTVAASSSLLYAVRSVRACDWFVSSYTVIAALVDEDEDEVDGVESSAVTATVLSIAHSDDSLLSVSSSSSLVLEKGGGSSFASGGEERPLVSLLLSWWCRCCCDCCCCDWFFFGLCWRG